MPAGALFIDQCYWPLSAPESLDNYEPLAEKMSQVTWSAIGSPPWDRPLTDARLEEIACAARHLHDTTEYAISLAVGCNLFEWSQFLFGMENLYLYLASEKRKLARFLDRLTELHLETLSRILPKVRGSVDILVVGDDLGMQSGPQMSRATYREMFLPRHKRIYNCARDLSGAHIFLHCCGGVYPLIPDLIEAGVEILNPVQTGARHMEPERLKREFGRAYVLGRRMRTQGLLASGTPSRCATTCAGASRSSCQAAGTCGTRCTTSWPMCRRKTWSLCWKRPTSSAATEYPDGDAETSCMTS